MEVKNHTDLHTTADKTWKIYANIYANYERWLYRGSVSVRLSTVCMTLETVFHNNTYTILDWIKWICFLIWPYYIRAKMLNYYYEIKGIWPFLNVQVQEQCLVPDTLVITEVCIWDKEWKYEELHLWKAWLVVKVTHQEGKNSLKWVLNYFNRLIVYDCDACHILMLISLCVFGFRWLSGFSCGEFVECLWEISTVCPSQSRALCHSHPVWARLAPHSRSSRARSRGSRLPPAGACRLTCRTTTTSPRESSTANCPSS